MSVEEISAILELNSIEGRQWCVIGSSAKTGEGLYEGLNFVVYINLVIDSFL